MKDLLFSAISGASVAVLGYMKGLEKDPTLKFDPFKVFSLTLFGLLAGYIAKLQGISIDAAHSIASTGALAYLMQLGSKVLYAYVAKAVKNLIAKLK